ncbi:MAG: NYN domain-containing protein [Nocardioidaceae bacterium]
MLGKIPVERLPGALKRVASFAPARRARLAGSQIAAALESDDDFRSAVAAQVRAAAPDLAAAVDAGEAPAAADPVEVAAVAYLLRAPEWEKHVALVTDAEEAEAAAACVRQSREQVDRLQQQLVSATEELHAVREKNREQLASLKAENADLRRKLNEARSRVKAAEAALATAEAQLADLSGAADAASSAAEAERRRLRARVDELERLVGDLKRGDRTSRDAATVRARLLLDTLTEAAQGLRRELALPAVEGAPADRVQGHEAVQGSRVSTGHGSLRADDPMLLEQLLALPRARLVVDGYNVTKTGWPELTLTGQRDRLVSGLASMVARLGAETTVVFDAAELEARPPVTAPRGVKVMFSAPGVIADDLIRALVDAEPAGRPVVVVSSDREVQRDVRARGFRAVEALALVRLLASR